jgi:hypothetical protein
MSRRALVLLALVAVVAAASFWWQSEQAADQKEALAIPSNASPAERLVLTQESVDALSAENAELASRIEALESQGSDAERLIELKTARLQSLEKSVNNQ